MTLQSVFTFIRGIFASEGEEARVRDGFLTVAHNIDISKTGRMKRRRGYGAWDDLQNNNSIPASFQSLSIPEVANFFGFEKKIQKIDSFTDVDGNRYIIVICDGKAYIEIKNAEGKREWQCLNPSGDIDLKEKVQPIDVAKLFGSVFLNDYSNNVYVYNTLENITGEGDLISTKLAYFSGARIWLRNYDYSADLTSFIWIDSDASEDWIAVSGDYRFLFEVGDIITVQSNGASNVNDGDYVVEDLTLASGNTRVWFEGNPITSDNAGNNVSEIIFNRRISLDGDTYPQTYNKEGAPIYDSLVDIGLIGGTGPLADATELNLSYSRRTGNASQGFRYFVLSNGQNEAGLNKCFIIELNDRLIAQQYKELVMDASGRVHNFDIYDGYIFICCSEGKIYRLDPDNNMTDSGWSTNDVAALEAPTDEAGDKLYSVIANDYGIWTYTKKLPVKTDWYQPIPGSCSFGFSHTLADVVDGVGGIDPPLVDEENVTVLGVSPRNDLFWAQNMIVPGQKALWQNTLWGAEEYEYEDDEAAHLFVYGMTPQPLSGRGELCIPNFLSEIVDSLFEGGNSKHGWKDGALNEWVPNEKEAYLISHHMDGGIEETVDFEDGDGITHSGRRQDFGTFSGNLLSPQDNIFLQVPRPFLYKYNTDWVANSNVVNLKVYTKNDQDLDVTFNNTMLLEGNSNYNSNYFTSMTVSKYACLVCIEHSGVAEGYLKSFDNIAPLDTGADLVNWRWVLPICELNQIRKMHPLQKKDNKVVFGASMIGDISVGYEDRGCVAYFDLDNYDLVYDYGSNVESKLFIPGPDVWLNRPASARFNGTYELGFSDDFVYAPSQSIFSSEDFWYFHTIFSSITPLTLKQAIDTGDEEVQDKLRFLGTPDRPAAQIANGTGDLVADTQLRYYTAFQTLAGKTTQLSIASDVIIIPNAFPVLTVQSWNVTNNRVSTDGNHNLAVDDKVVFATTGGDDFPPEITPGVIYYVNNVVDSNTINLKETLTGSVLVITAQYGVTGQTIQQVNQDAKVIITGLDLFSSSDVQIYSDDAISEIHVYRSQKDRAGTVWTPPTKIGTLTKDAAGDWVSGVFPPETFEDTTQDPAYVGFPTQDVLKYPVYDILVHKNRFILVGRADTNNPNVIQYSSVNYPEDLSDVNFRDIQAADGDFLTSGISVGDFLYLFKRSRIYAILGDVYDGQLLDITSRIGAPFRNMITSYDNRVVYFINEDGVFAIINNTVRNLSAGRLDNFFDAERYDAINFNALENNGFTYVDLKKSEIQWFVPRKFEGRNIEENNCVIIYNIEYDYFRIYQYSHPISSKTDAFDVITEDKMTLMATNTGQVFKVSLEKNDAGKSIKWIMRTKAFNANSSLINKRYKILKVYGNNINNLRATYWLDKIRSAGGVEQGANAGAGGISVLITSHGIDHEIIIELSGEDRNESPMEISEILIGYDTLRGSIR